MLESKPKIHILLSAVGYQLSKNWKEQANFTDDLKKQAYDAWINRQPSEKTVRFLYKLPTKYGALFRFFTVKEKDDGSLIISKE
ncbi:MULTISPECIES: hypothetical protein [Pasteurellaceae]|uniref:Hemophilus-specific protein n=1 Tax=Glaesserella australis TaxID=2094024 RepID=A0A328BWJ3_9PAST|nr:MULTISPECIES: hypothetical protein [Pasteurellaceae]AUI65859.1 hypothetical protein CJD39_04400 [Glaesserella sp. 15-184]RAL17995.1 hypothetical protein C5N92_10180 [Glaesserella australis]